MRGYGLGFGVLLTTWKSRNRKDSGGYYTKLTLQLLGCIAYGSGYCGKQFSLESLVQRLAPEAERTLNSGSVLRGPRAYSSFHFLSHYPCITPRIYHIFYLLKGDYTFFSFSLKGLISLEFRILRESRWSACQLPNVRFWTYLQPEFEPHITDHHRCLGFGVQGLGCRVYGLGFRD